MKVTARTTPIIAPAAGPGPLLYSPSQCARALNISPRTLWSLTAAGEIPALKIGRLVRYDPEDLRAFIARKRAAAENGRAGVAEAGEG